MMRKRNLRVSSIASVITRIARAAKEKGLAYVLRGIWLNIWVDVESIIHRVWPTPTFQFQQEEYEYFWHRYSSTWRNERAVEVPIIQAMVEKYRGKRILEVGNVLSHYFHVPYEVVDKYELGEDVINRDILEFSPSSSYDLIVSISTLEHVGWDEMPREPEKILRAVNHLRSLLAPGGLLAVTLPLGYNHQMDAMLASGALRFPRQYYFKRTDSRRWVESSWEEVLGSKYEDQVTATALVIGMAENR